MPGLGTIGLEVKVTKSYNYYVILSVEGSNRDHIEHLWGI
jgi:hypothetical protein